MRPKRGCRRVGGLRSLGKKGGNTQTNFGGTARVRTGSLAGISLPGFLVVTPPATSPRRFFVKHLSECGLSADDKAARRAVLPTN